VFYLATWFHIVFQWNAIAFSHMLIFATSSSWYTNPAKHIYCAATMYTCHCIWYQSSDPKQTMSCNSLATQTINNPAWVGWTIQIWGSAQDYCNLLPTTIRICKSTACALLQCVPLPTKPGISLIILTRMKILQRNLNRSTSLYEKWRGMCS